MPVESPVLEPLLTRRNLLIALCLSLVLLGVYWFTFSGSPLSTDEIFMFDATESLVRRGNTQRNLTANYHLFREFPIGEQPNVTTVAVEPMQILAAALFFAIAEVIPGVGLVHTVWLLNVFLCAAGGGLLFLYARSLGYRERVGVAGALIYGLGTLAWPYSKVFFREPLAMVLLFGAGLCLNAARDRWRTQQGWLWLAGFAVVYVMGLLAKEAALLSIPILLALAVPRLTGRGGWRRLALILAVGVAFLLVAALVISVVMDAVDVLSAYNPIRRLEDLSENAGYIGYAFVSYLFSPGKGLFAFSPVLLLGLPGVWLLACRRRWREAAIPVVAVLAFVVGYAVIRNVHWYGGLSWGPRYLVPVTLFAMLATLPALDTVLQAGAARRARIGAAVVIGLGIWAQLNGVLIAQLAYFEELRARDVIAWEGGTWDLRHAAILANPPLLSQRPLDFAWLRAVDAGAWLPLGAVLLAAGGGAGLWWLRRQRADISRRVFVAALLIAVVGVSGVFYAGLRSIYVDPRFIGQFERLHELFAEFDAQARPDDILVLANPTYQDFTLNYYRNRDVILFTLPTAVGEQPSPEQPPGVVSNNPDMLLEPRRSIFLMNLPEYTDRVWLLNSSGPFTPYTVRPVEWFMARHYFPLLTIAPDESARLALFSVNADAPPEQAMQWPELPVEVRFGDEVELLGADLPGPRVR
ncbi:MAG: hypothetical protein JW910_01090, partial [Anaerolineae bacterium]|nr:hypothetical protein [Anaerolineae bacterium]